MNIKNKKGVTLLSLTITIVILLIVSNITIYSVANNLEIKNLKDMQNDIENLKDKVSNYYVKYGTLPIVKNKKYTDLSNIQEAGVINEEVDKGDFYVIDLSALENLTLNYGKDYENIQAEDNINDLEDIYIINDVSHNIFYAKGIKLNDKFYYTNYTSDSMDTETVKLKYVDNIKIPSGYTYIEGNKESGIKIKKEDDDTKTYIWVEVENFINAVPNQISVSNDEEFIESVNLFNGYYKSESDNLAIYLPVEEKWSDEYDKTTQYKDTNGDIATIPEGFQVSKVKGQDQINKGLVVKNSATQDEYVWIPCTVSEYLKVMENNWVKTDYNDKIWKDTQGIAVGEASIAKYNGFYVARYEAGIPENATEIYASSDGDSYNTSRNVTTYTPVSQKGKQSWNFVTQANAKILAEKMISDTNTDVRKLFNRFVCMEYYL